MDFKDPLATLFPPAEALEKNSDSIKEYYPSGGALPSHVSDHATVTKVQKDDGGDSQRKNMRPSSNSFMFVCATVYWADLASLLDYWMFFQRGR